MSITPTITVSGNAREIIQYLENQGNGKRYFLFVEPDSEELVSNNEPSDPTLALFDAWDKQDAAMTEEELEAERRLFAEFENNVNESRQEAGMRTL